MTKKATPKKSTPTRKAAAKRIRTATPRRRAPKVPVVTAGALDRAAGVGSVEDPVVALATETQRRVEAEERIAVALRQLANVRQALDGLTVCLGKSGN